MDGEIAGGIEEAVMPEPSRHPDAAGGEPSAASGERPGRFREPLWRDVVGEVLREERQARERTLQDVADAARISMPYLSEIERGRKEASSEVLAAATRALGISMTELLIRVQLRLVASEREATAQAAYVVGGAQYMRAATVAARATATGASRQAQGRSRDALCLAA